MFLSIFCIELQNSNSLVQFGAFLVPCGAVAIQQTIKQKHSSAPEPFRF